jgi:hypothetical protein
MFMRLTPRTLIVCSLFVFANPANAASDGERSFAFGPYLGASYTQVNDPDGSTNRSAALSRIGVVSTYLFDRRTQVESELYFHKDSFSASNHAIGQKVIGYGFAAQYYRNFPVARGFRPWLGAGLSLNNFKYKDRYTTESGGFLAQQYSDRNDQEISVLFSAKLITGEDNNVSVFYRLSYALPLTNGVQGFLFNVGILF